MTIHSPSLSTDSVFCACEKERKKKDTVTIKTIISQIKIHPTNTHTLKHLFFSSSTGKPISTPGVKQTRQVYILYKHFAIFTAFCFSNSHRSFCCKLPLFIINATTTLSDSSHCKHAEFSTVPLTLTVSICPFTDSVLGGVPLEVETLTVEREM